MFDTGVNCTLACLLVCLHTTPTNFRLHNCHYNQCLNKPNIPKIELEYSTQVHVFSDSLVTLYVQQVRAIPHHCFLDVSSCFAQWLCIAILGWRTNTTTVFMQKIPCDAAQSDQVSKSTAIIEHLKSTLQMKHNFELQCEHWVEITVSLMCVDTV